MTLTPDIEIDLALQDIAMFLAWMGHERLHFLPLGENQVEDFEGIERGPAGEVPPAVTGRLDLFEWLRTG